MRLEATPKGTKILREGRKRRVESLAKALASLSEKERAQLGELVEVLQRVIRSL
jgi:DNA-binding MarR family transcriptional regulator